mgnify:CR=1 FL=1
MVDEKKYLHCKSGKNPGVLPEAEAFRKEPEEPQGAKQAENRLSDQYPCVPVTGDDPSERQNMEQG